MGTSATGVAAIPEEERFESIYERHYQSVLAYCLRRAVEADAHDVVSEVFSTAWRRLADIPEGDRQLAWLYAVAKHVLWRQARGAGRFRRLTDRVGSLRHADVEDVAADVVGRTEHREVLEACSRLRAADQEILRLAGWEGLRHAEIAEVLGISVGVVDQRFHRAKKRLAATYAEIAGPIESPAVDGSPQ